MRQAKKCLLKWLLGTDRNWVYMWRRAKWRLDRWKSLTSCAFFRYKCVFAAEEQELGCATDVEYEFHLTNDVPIKLLYRQIPPNRMAEVKAHKGAPGTRCD